MNLRFNLLDDNQDDWDFWLDLYSDPVVQKQMYKVPEDYKAYFKGSAHIVWNEDQRIGGFSFDKINDHVATFGILLHKNYRGKGFAPVIVKELVEPMALNMGFTSLRVDIYKDNVDSIRLFEKCGYREFVWLEKNL